MEAIGNLAIANQPLARRSLAASLAHMNIALAVPAIPRPGPPMPADLLDAVPETAALSVSEIGAVFRLCRVFWQGAARPLPANDSALMTLSGCNARVWFHIRKPVIEAWRALEPIAGAVYAKAVVSEASKEAARSKGGLTAAANRRSREIAKNDAVSLSDIAVLGPLTPGKQFSTVGDVYAVNGVAIPKRVVRNNAARLTDRT